MNHFQLLVMKRISDHQEAEAKREEETRQRIRIEEERKANAAAREAAMPKVLETIDHGNGVKTIVVEGTATAQPDSDEPAIWRQAKSGVVAMLDSLTISELEAVADYINRKAWSKYPVDIALRERTPPYTKRATTIAAQIS